jgi:hypothetical protein
MAPVAAFAAVAVPTEDAGCDDPHPAAGICSMAAMQ